MRAITSLLCILFFISLPARAVILGPYSPDSATLHLWHLDETVVPAVDSAAGGTNLTCLTNGATLGSASFAGFGNALNTTDGGIKSSNTGTNRDAILAASSPYSGNNANSILYADPTTGAFTMEAIVRIDFDPLASYANRGTASQMQIICGESLANANRIFQFRIDPIGTTSGNTSTLLEFINVNQAISVQNIRMTLPTTGPDAALSNNWYHVA